MNEGGRGEKKRVQERGKRERRGRERRMWKMNGKNEMKEREGGVGKWT